MCEDHPRLCGEKSDMLEKITWNLGSPPPMRGKVQQLPDRFRFLGITPAYAGKSIFDCVISTCKMGSPPPMRGKAIDFSTSNSTGGITPAYAGKRSVPDCWCPCRRDHPRLCGEKCTKYKLMICATGSPPPMRGKVHLCKREFPNARITPAYAGKRFR